MVMQYGLTVMGTHVPCGIWDHTALPAPSIMHMLFTVKCVL